MHQHDPPSPTKTKHSYGPWKFHGSLFIIMWQLFTWFSLHVMHTKTGHKRCLCLVAKFHVATLASQIHINPLTFCLKVLKRVK